MSELPPRVGTPLDRLVNSVRAWDKIPVSPPQQRGPRRSRIDQDQITLERAKGAVMLRYGVNSHVAFAMIARWARTAEIPITTLATALVNGTVDNLDTWLEERRLDDED
jgi:ANTAR domain